MRSASTEMWTRNEELRVERLNRWVNEVGSRWFTENQHHTI